MPRPASSLKTQPLLGLVTTRLLSARYVVARTSGECGVNVSGKEGHRLGCVGTRWADGGLHKVQMQCLEMLVKWVVGSHCRVMQSLLKVQISISKK